MSGPTDRVTPRFVTACLAAALVLFGGGGDLEAHDAFLRPHDKIMWIGDSITAQNIYETYVMRVLKTLYPDADITDVNRGTGGATAPSQFPGIPKEVETHQPTIMTVMFGVNDTGWGLGNEQLKAETYSQGLQKYADLAKEKNLELLFLRGTHFSHNQHAAALEIGLDAVLMKLFDAQQQLAAANGRSVVDAYGAYIRELENAWKVDPKYEFTPNFVHPTMLGHCAVAGAILNAWGAGLPLAGPSERGPLHLDSKPPVALSAKSYHGTLANDGKLAIRVQAANLTDKALPGVLTVVVGATPFTQPLTLSTKDAAEFTFELPVAAMPKRWEVQPIYLAFVSQGVFAANQVPLYYSHLIPTAGTPFAHDGKGWVEWEGRTPAESTVSDLSVKVGPDVVRAEFSWKDESPVLAQMVPYKARQGEPVKTPLDMTTPFGQPCDAVEILLDLRDEQSSARYTSNMDSLPEDTVRVGLYKIEEDGKPVCKLQVLPESQSGAFKLTELGNDRYAIQWSSAAGQTVPACGVGFDMFVTDAKQYAPNKTIGAYLTSVAAVGLDWVDFYRLSSEKEGVFCRIGY